MKDDGAVNTLESFVGKLYADGVEAGRQEAARLRAAAERDAAELLERAKQEAGNIVAAADARAQRMLQEANSEIALAMRDAQLALRAQLSQALNALLQQSLESELKDPAMLHELIVDYLRSLARTGADSITVNVSRERAEQFTAAAVTLLGDSLARHTIVCDTLQSAGFELELEGAVIEVTPDAVAEVLSELIAPQLRKFLRDAVSADAGRAALQPN